MTEDLEKQAAEDELIEETIAKSAQAEIANQLGGDLPPEEEAKTDEQESDVTDESTDDTQDDDGEEVPANLFAGYTEDEIKSAISMVEMVPQLQKALDTTNGRYGNELQSLRTELQEVRAQRVNAFSDLSPERLKRLNAEYPELAEIFADDLKNLQPEAKEIPETQGTTEQEKEVVTAQPDIETQQRLDQLEKEAKIRAENDLSKAHPDWRETAGYLPENGVLRWKNPEFGAWVEKQPAETQQAVFNGNSPNQIADVLTAYKNSKNPPEKKIKKPDLAKALLPEGSNSASRGAMTEEDVIAAAAQKTRMREMTGT